MRFLAGKCLPTGGIPGGYSLIIPPFAGIWPNKSSLHEEWDEAVKQFFRKNGIPVSI